jgi:membrane protease YdiL (CAAX protease family)
MAVAAVAAAYGVVGGVEWLTGGWASTWSILLAIGADDGRLASAGPVLTGIILLRACVLAAVGEELLFRGALYTWLRQRLGAGATVSITAVAFALIHGFPAVLPLAFALGVCLGWVRERSGSIVPTVIVHAVHNFGLVAVSYALTGWSARLPQWGG